jgi:hypothetical protein
MKLRFCFIVLLAFQLLQAQETWYLRPLRTKTKIDGFVRKMFEDKWGMLWMLTYDRILRYDGTDIETFDALVKPDLGLRDAYPADDKIILNYENHSLRLLDIRTMKMSNLELPPAVGAADFIDSKAGIFYIYSRHSMEVSICRFTDGMLLLLNTISGINTDELNGINDTAFIARTFGSTKSILVTIAKNGSNEKISFDNHGSLQLHVFDREIYFIGTEPTLYSFDAGNSRERFIKALSGNYSSCLAYDKLYLFSTLHNYQFSLKSFAEQEILFGGEPSSRESARTFCVYTTHAGRKFISNASGVFEMIGSLSPVKKYELSAYPGIKGASTSVRCLNYSASKQELYLGLDNEGGALVLSARDNFKAPRFIRAPSHPDQTFASISNIINNIFLDNNGDIYFGTNTLGFKLSALTNSVVPSSIGYCRDLYKDSLSRYWSASTHLRLYRVDTTGVKDFYWVTGPAHHITIDPSKESRSAVMEKENIINTSLPDFKTWDIEPYKDLLFISSTKGLLIFDRTREIFLSPAEALHSKDSFTARAWHSRVVGKYLYVATQGEGVFKINLETGESTKPVPDNMNTFMVESFDGKNVWITSSDRLTYLQEDGSYFELPVSDYALPEELAFHGLCNLDGKKFFVSGRGGFSIINASEMIHQMFSRRSEAIIKKFKVDDAVYASCPESNSFISLPYDSSSLVFEISNTLLDNAEQMKLRYRLSGFDDGFTESAGNNAIVYKNLPYGEYRLELYTRNSNAQWDKSPLWLTIRIRPPWFLSVYAKSGYILLFLLLGSLAYLLIKRRLDQKRRSEIAFIESELTAIRAQINPHFMFNALNSIQSFIMLNDRKEANNYLTVFSQLVRKVLDVSSKELITIESEVSWMKDYLALEALRFESLEWSIKIDPSIPLDSEIPSMVSQPVIENAIIHGLFPKLGKGKLIITFSKGSTSSMILCEIIDNGVGRTDKPRLHESKGTRLVKNRLEYISRRYNCESIMEIIDLHNKAGIPVGTHVKISLPLI